jgi:hypothetical protein
MWCVGRNMFIVSILQTKFDMLSFSYWLVVTVRPQARENFYVGIFCICYIVSKLIEWNEWYIKLRSFNYSFLLMLLTCSLKSYNPRQWLLVFRICLLCDIPNKTHFWNLISSITRWHGGKAHAQLNLLESTNLNYWTSHCILFRMVNSVNSPEIQ